MRLCASEHVLCALGVTLLHALFRDSQGLRDVRELVRARAGTIGELVSLLGLFGLFFGVPGATFFLILFFLFLVDLFVLFLELLIIELLLCDCYERKMSFPLAARGLVDEYDAGAEGADELAAAIKQKQKATEAGSSMPTSTWRSSSDAKRAAKLLTDVACACTRVTSKRKAPAQVLAQLESAGEIVTQHLRGSSAMGWLGM